MQVVNPSKTVPKSIKDVPFIPLIKFFFYRLEDRGLNRTFGLLAVMGWTSHLMPFANSLRSIISYELSSPADSSCNSSSTLLGGKSQRN